MNKTVKYGEKEYNVILEVSTGVNVFVNGCKCEEAGPIRKNTYFAAFNDNGRDLIVISYFGKLFVYEMPADKTAKEYAEELTYIKLRLWEKILLGIFWSLPFATATTMVEKNIEDLKFPLIVLAVCYFGVFGIGFFKHIPCKSQKHKRIMIYLCNAAVAIIASIIGLVGLGYISF
jgi:hypothetical protein